MQSVTTALFERPANARGALIEIGRRLGFRKPGLRVMVRSAKSPASELPLEATDATTTMGTSALFGAVGGVLVSLGAYLLLRGSPSFSLTELIFAFVAGAALGLFGGALTGSMSPRLPFEKIKALAGDGGLLVTVESDAETTAHKAENIMRKHAGMVSAVA
jgi:hypothetical protein